MPRRERDGDYIEGEDVDDHGVEEGKDGESDHSFVGSLSEASDHIAGVDDTSDHPDDPIRIQAAPKANPTANKRTTVKEQHIQAHAETKTKEDEANHASNSDNEEASEEESGESDENDDDDDYQEASSESNDGEDEEDCGAIAPAPKRKAQAAAKKRVPKPKKAPAKKKIPKARAIASNRGKPRRGLAKRRKSSEQEDFDEEEESEGEEESDDYEEGPRRGRAPKRRKSRRGKTRALGAYKVVGSSGEENSSESEGGSEVKEDESEEYEIEEQSKQPRKRKQRKGDEMDEYGSDEQHSKGEQLAPEKRRPSRAAARSTRQRAPSYKDFNSSDEETESGSENQSEEEESNPKTRPKQKQAGKPKGISRASCAPVARAESQSEDEEGESEGTTSEESTKQTQGKQSARPIKRSRPSRASTAKATYTYDDEEGDEEQEEEMPRVRKVRKKPKVGSDEEEFKLGEAEKEQEEDDAELEEIGNSSGEESFLKGVASVRSSDSQIVGTVDSSEFDEDEVSDGGSEKSADGIRSRRGPKASNVQKARAARAPDVYHRRRDNDEAEIQPTPTKGRLSQEERTRSAKQHRTSSKSKHLHCPSKTDAITEDPLPQIHVCYVAPDRNSRQCFSLETIHKIATTSKHPEYRTNLSDKRQLTFLQPPHFRSAMSDEMLDQIASSFGRQALDLNGSFYNKKEEAAGGASGSEDGESDAGGDEYQVHFTRSHTNTESFNTAWKMFQIKTMGSQDIYPCPLCYTVAHHRLVSAREVEGQIPLPDEFKYGPMEILGSPDNEKYEVAAGFCFKSIAKVKAHLRREHNCNTVRIDSSVFNRYKVRAPDGLLQRYLAQKNRKSPGSMRRYWYEGHSEEYVYLLYQMEKWESHDDNESIHPSTAFCESFQDRDVDLWERICAPYSAGNADMQDFLADGEDEDGDGEAPYTHHVFDQARAAAEHEDDNARAQYYADKAAEHEDDSSRYADEDEEDYESAYASESELEEDDWVAERSRRKKKVTVPSGKSGGAQRKKRSARKQRQSRSDSSDDDLCGDDDGRVRSRGAMFGDSESD